MRFIFYCDPKKGGVYKITNIVNCKVYFGSTKKFRTRSKRHLSELIAQNHCNKHLQTSFNKHGTDNFLFETLQVVMGNKLERTTVEQEYINLYIEKWDRCFNNQKKSIQGDACNSPVVIVVLDPAQVRLNISNGKKAFYQTDIGKELKQKFSDDKKGKSYEEVYGEVRAAEIKKTISDNKLIEMNKPEVKENLRRQLIGISFEERFGPERAKEIKTKQGANRKGKHTGRESFRFRIIENIKLVSPTGEIYTKIEGIVDFSVAHGLRSNSFSELLSGKLKSHRGWRLIK